MKIALSCLALLCLLPAAFGAISSVTAAIRGFTVTSNLAAQPAASVIALRFTGLSTNLVSGTDFTAAQNGGSANAWSFTITGLNTGNYSVSDDSGSTWNTNSGAGWLTQCMSPDVPAITLDTTAANSNTYSNGGRLRLRLRFLENNRYSAISYRYRGGELNCNSTVNSAVATTFQSWTRTPSTSTCGAPYLSYEHDFNDALTRCNYFRDESNPASTVYNATIVITTVDTGVVIRTTRYSRTLESTVTIRISFDTNISTTNNAVSVFGPRITFSQVTQQLWNPFTSTATLTVLTSVQWPYQLATNTLVVSPSVPSDWSANTIAATPQDGANDINGVAWSRRAQCTSQTTGQPCTQYWTVTLTRSQQCNGANSLNFNGIFTMAFNVTCPALFTGACSATAPFVDSITFATNSTNYCPQLITNANLNTASLTTFSNTGYSTAQSQFVFGTTTYFTASVTAPILINSIGIESISVTAGGTMTSPYYNKSFTSAATWFPSSGSTVAGTGVYTAQALCSGNSYASVMTVTDNVITGDAFTKTCRFSILWGACSSAASGDSPQSTTVQVNLRVRYTNQSTVGGVSFIKLYAQAKHLPVPLEDSNGAEASTVIAVAPTGTNGGVAAGGDASSSASTTMVAGIAAGVAAAAALLVGITAYVVRRGRVTKSEQTNSVQLSSSTSTIQQ